MKNRKILITVILCLSVFLIALDIYGVWFGTAKATVWASIPDF